MLLFQRTLKCFLLSSQPWKGHLSCNSQLTDENAEKFGGFTQYYTAENSGVLRVVPTVFT